VVLVFGVLGYVSKLNRKIRSRNRGIRILNPIPDGSSFTTRKVANDMVSRGRAVWDSDTWDSIKLVDRLILDSLERTIIDSRMNEAREMGILRDRKGVIYWNGSDKHPGAHHRPGEVVS
jgi:hypothetical protein